MRRVAAKFVPRLLTDAGSLKDIPPMSVFKNCFEQRKNSEVNGEYFEGDQNSELKY